MNNEMKGACPNRADCVYPATTPRRISQTRFLHFGKSFKRKTWPALRGKRCSLVSSAVPAVQQKRHPTSKRTGFQCWGVCDGLPIGVYTCSTSFRPVCKSREVFTELNTIISRLFLTLEESRSPPLPPVQLLKKKKMEKREGGGGVRVPRERQRESGKSKSKKSAILQFGISFSFFLFLFVFVVFACFLFCFLFLFVVAVVHLGVRQNLDSQPYVSLPAMGVVFWIHCMSGPMKLLRSSSRSVSSSNDEMRK